VEEGDGDGRSGFAEAVRAWRQRRGWTQEQLSHASGLSTRAIRSLERGRTLSPRRTTVQMLADALQVPQSRLMARMRRVPATDVEPDFEAAGEYVSGIPRELPPDLGDATLDARHVVTALVAEPAEPYRGAVVEIEGPHAAGLAVRAAHHVSAKFPDGQLYADLAGAPPVAPAAILRRLLRSLDQPERPADGSPFTTDELAAAFRSALAGRRILVVLVGARSEAQVRLLIPAESRCALLVAYSTGPQDPATPPAARTS